MRWSFTIARTGGHVPRYAVRIGRRDDDGPETRLSLSLHESLADAEAARDRARRHPDVAWRQAERAAEARARELATRRTLGKRGRGERNQSVIPADASPRRVAFETLPYEQDAEARAFVAAHPDGATLEECGEWLGVTRERVRQMEGEALVSLARELRRAGITEATQSDIVCWSDGGAWWQ